MTSAADELSWNCAPFTALTTDQLYAILALRELIFTREQSCTDIDCDWADQHAYHLQALDTQGELVAYARFFIPTTSDKPAKIGRIVVAKAYRGLGLGKTIVKKCIAQIEDIEPRVSIALSAQAHLAALYQQFGFAVTGEPYDEGGIEHIYMIRG